MTTLVSALPRQARGEQVFLTYEQIDRLAEAGSPERSAILFLAYTGVRYGEMAALRVRNLNLLRRRALINEAVADVNGHAVFGTPKTQQRRQVPVPRFLADERTRSGTPQPRWPSPAART